MISIYIEDMRNLKGDIELCFLYLHLLSNYSMYICLRLRTNSFIAEKEF